MSSGRTLRSIFIISPASAPATVPAGQSAPRLDDPQVVRVVLHPDGAATRGHTRRSRLRFHSRLPALLLDLGDGRAEVELACRAGDVLCVVRERSGGRGRWTGQTVSVAAVPGNGRTAEVGPLVRLAGVDRPVRLLAHLAGGAAGRFLGHLDRLEAAGVDPADVAPSFWTHLAAAAEVEVDARRLPWPDEWEDHQEGRP